ncbi:MAG: hypothetical protein KF841_00605 [Phycisphaerae bacterium]|nr:hypothetical protein [Phycisphaerae bacterium]
MPDSLSRAFAQRMRFQTAYFEYEYRAFCSNAKQRPKLRYEARFAGKDLYWAELGDEDGIRSHEITTGQPILGVRYACTPERAVRCNDGKDEWSIRDGEFTVRAQPTPERFLIRGTAPERLLDPRSAGLCPVTFSETSPDDLLQEIQQKGYEWSEKSANGIIEVSGSLKKQAAEGEPFRIVVWRIDPEKDDAILEMRVYAGYPDGRRELLERIEADHAQFDGRWWPTRCITTLESRPGSEEFTFTRVEFDRKEHPSKLGPDILGIPPGLAAVDRIRRTSGSGPLKMGRYVGDGQIVSVNEWYEHHKEKHNSPELTNFLSRAQAIGDGEYPKWWSAGEETLGLENVARTPDLWEVYLRRWIIRHSYAVEAAQGASTAQSLTPAQVDAAWAILKDCRKRTVPVLLRMKEDPGLSPPDASANKEMQLPTTMPGNNEMPANSQTPNRYEKELDTIFQSLKTRLSALLSTKQKNAEAKEPS